MLTKKIQPSIQREEISLADTQNGLCNDKNISIVRQQEDDRRRLRIVFQKLFSSKILLSNLKTHLYISNLIYSEPSCDDR